MIIYPAIDIKDKSCVRLTQGSYDNVTIYEKDPVKVALKWESMGAKILHLVDLDGARDGKRINESIVRDIVNNVKIPIQIGGGIRDTEGVELYLNMGVSQVIIGTAAIKNPSWLKEMIERYNDKIVVSIDAKNGLIATDGWESISNKKALDYIKELKDLGLGRIVYTDIEKDGMLEGPNFSIYEALQGEVDIEVIASGGVTTMTDINRLKDIGLYGAIIGKALYDGKLNLEEVLK
ncbi:1-(5-phosphoribosyl)-5-[(5-phosphoribosylamino)methylideneamino]imidazole-4-carboxamide isomerase [Tissierella creatinini]|nr:1-(5-phosphoribosyl)-5-[(5-phosphoribosylamino)methylideneamino]imidazole-4-carboxamide isomerase [Tissierella creatinini]TJX66744.1 1-(5-phosphoribosyl)-5-[(5-phosphoribosylamino)methylideneamino]imidazole-4-carboxamide isomerase [Soehngenia saccharolytica]